MDTEKLRKRYEGPMVNQDIMDCIEEIERLRKALREIENCPQQLLDGKQPITLVMAKIAGEALKEE